MKKSEKKSGWGGPGRGGGRKPIGKTPKITKGVTLSPELWALIDMHGRSDFLQKSAEKMLNEEYGINFNDI